MAAQSTTQTLTEKPATPALRHEEWCQPTADYLGVMRSEVRIESFPYYADDAATGRSRITHRITRCCECGASRYEPIGA